MSTAIHPKPDPSKDLACKIIDLIESESHKQPLPANDAIHALIITLASGLVIFGCRDIEIEAEQVRKDLINAYRAVMIAQNNGKN